jgi:hypothetical protein
MANNKTNKFEEAVLKDWFHQTDWTSTMTNTGTSLYLALFTADPTEAGSTANEAAYGDYARVAVARTTAGWTLTTSATGATTIENAADVVFNTCTAGTETITHAAIMTGSSVTTATANTDMLIYGDLNSSLAVSSGIQPQFSAGSIVFEEK